ncbi:MFS transporter [Nakamurella lactea]|uniref:MFS transporter n=1 Tax=Nakamurella lactea TaxID=459515 RepID=UPI0003FB9731|nr:MFS transporter [Nakamurella lactea]
MTSRQQLGAAAGDRYGDDARHPSVRGPRALLALRGLRQLVILRLLGALGDGAFQGALAGAVLFSPERHSDATSIAAGFAVLLLPYSVLGPFAGALLDRWSRRQVLVWANLIRCLLVLVVAVAIAAEAPEVVLFVTALFVTGASRFVGSGLSAAIPHTAPADSLTGANSLSTTVGSIATLIGGGVAFGLRALIGDTHWPIAFVTCSVVVFYLLAAWSATPFSRRALGPDETDEPPQPLLAVLQGLGSSLRYLVRKPSVGLAIGVVMLVRFCFGLATLLVLLLFQHHFVGHGIFAAGVAGIGQVLAVAGAGLLAGAVSTAWFARRLGMHHYLVILLVVSAMVVLVAGSRFTEPMTMLTAFVLAFGYQSAKVCADTVVQSDSDDAHVGRVFALYDTGNNVFYVAAFAVGVLLVPPDGRTVVAPILIAVVYLIAAGWFWWGTRALQRRAV